MPTISTEPSARVRPFQNEPSCRSGRCPRSRRCRASDRSGPARSARRASRSGPLKAAFRWEIVRGRLDQGRRGAQGLAAAVIGFDGVVEAADRDAVGRRGEDEAEERDIRLHIAARHVAFDEIALVGRDTVIVRDIVRRRRGAVDRRRTLGQRAIDGAPNLNPARPRGSSLRPEGRRDVARILQRPGLAAVGGGDDRLDDRPPSRSWRR